MAQSNITWGSDLSKLASKLRDPSDYSRNLDDVFEPEGDAFEFRALGSAAEPDGPEADLPAVHDVVPAPQARAMAASSAEGGEVVDYGAWVSQTRAAAARSAEDPVSFEDDAFHFNESITQARAPADSGNWASYGDPSQDWQGTSFEDLFELSSGYGHDLGATDFSKWADGDDFDPFLELFGTYDEPFAFTPFRLDADTIL